MNIYTAAQYKYSYFYIKNVIKMYALHTFLYIFYIFYTKNVNIFSIKYFIFKEITKYF